VSRSARPWSRFHGGPGLDHINMKQALAPLADDVQIIFYDQRGHGRSDRSRAEFWNLPTWADDLRRLCDALGLAKPVVLGSSFGGFVALTYAGLFPAHPGGVILTNTTGGRIDHPASVEIFRRLGGDEAAAVAARDFAELTEESADEFNRVCHPLYSSKPGFVEESRQGLARSIQTTEANPHHFRNEAPLERAGRRHRPGPDPGRRRRPDLPNLCRRGPRAPPSSRDNTTGSLPQARHRFFRDRPDLAFPAVKEFLHDIGQDPASEYPARLDG
jgi:pimeloyl-ACP methyl ester carboxylesterase